MDERFALDFIDDVDPRDLDAESVRSILAATTNRATAVSRKWINLALDETNFEPHFSRLAHLAPELPRDMMGAIVSDIADDLEALEPPDWYRALVVSRLAPLARNPDVFLTQDSDHRHWTPFLERLALAKPPTGQFGDVLRAHPSAVDLLRHAPPQEIAAEAVSHIRGADDVDDNADGSAATPAAVRERVLNASVYVDGSEHTDTAFVSGVRHLVAVSFSRADLVPVTSAFDHQIRGDQASTAKLIVRLVFNGLVAESPLLLPLDPAIDAAPATFAITPGGAQESLTARIIVYAPNGVEIVEAVALSGDVVSTVEAARFHGGNLQLERRVQVRRPLTEVTSAVTSSILIDQHVAIAATPSGVRVADIHTLQTRLAQLVARIERAEAGHTPAEPAPAKSRPGNDDFDRAIADGPDRPHDDFIALATELASSGHALRAAVDQHLGNFTNERDIQLVQTNPSLDLPLELLYSGPEPSVVTPFCAAWGRSRQPNGACPTCTDSPTSAVCISHFWGTTKNIDRRSGRRPSIRTDLADELPLADAAIIAASHLVDPTISAQVHTVADVAIGQAIPALTWNDWRLAATRNDGLLIGLVNHHLTENASSADEPARIPSIEVGGDQLFLTDINAAFVAKETGQPGPIVVLIPAGVPGSSEPESTFAAVTNHVGAPFVITTFARSSPVNAGNVAQIAVGVLTSGRSLPLRESVRVIRSELLTRSVPIGFLVIGYGDGDWRRQQ